MDNINTSNENDFEKTCSMLKKMSSQIAQTIKLQKTELSEQNIKLLELYQDNTFLTELFALDSIEQAQEAFANKGVELEFKEVENLITSLHMTHKKVKENSGELTEDDLKSISGGAGFFNNFFSNLFYQKINDAQEQMDRMEMLKGKL